MNFKEFKNISLDMRLVLEIYDNPEWLSKQTESLLHFMSYEEIDKLLNRIEATAKHLRDIICES